MFATFSYISPTMTELGGFGRAAIPLILAPLRRGHDDRGGAVRDGVAHRPDPGDHRHPGGDRRDALSSLRTAAVQAAKWSALVAVFTLGLLPSALVPMLQTRLMDVAHEGQALAAALNHSTLNIADALGAWLGSIVLSAGMGYEWPFRVGEVRRWPGSASPLVRPAAALSAARGLTGHADQHPLRRLPDRLRGFRRRAALGARSRGGLLTGQPDAPQVQQRVGGGGVDLLGHRLHQCRGVSGPAPPGVQTDAPRGRSTAPSPRT